MKKFILKLGEVINKKSSPFKLTCTTTGAQTLTLQGLTVAAGKTVTVVWGDGSSNTYTAGSGTRTHAYAGAGAWLIKIMTPGNITLLDLEDTKLSGTINAANPLPSNLTILTLKSMSNLIWTVGPGAPVLPGLTYLFLYGLPMLTWTVGAAAPMPTGLTNLYLYNLPGFTWTVGASAPMPSAALVYLFVASLSGLTWAAGAAAPLPTKLSTGLTIVSCAGVTIDPGQWALINSIKIIRFENNLNASQVNAILQAIWSNKANYTWATPSLDLLGTGNAAPSGVYQAASPPSTGKEYAYDLVNGAYTSAGPEWTVATA